MSNDVIRTVRTALYKGKPYILHFIGKTKFGVRAQLGFWGPSGTCFWVPADMVQETAPTDINSQGWKFKPGKPSVTPKAYTPVQQEAPASSEDALLEERASQYANMEDDMPF